MAMIRNDAVTWPFFYLSAQKTGGGEAILLRQFYLVVITAIYNRKKHFMPFVDELCFK